MSRFRALPFVSALAVAAALALASCGGDDEEQAPEDAAAPTVDVDRYCELTQQLDQAGEEQFRELEQGNAIREEFEAAERELVEQNQDLFDEIQQGAPPEIQGDVETLIAGLRDRAGLEEEGPSQQEQQAAEQRIQQFEQENCQGA